MREGKILFLKGNLFFLAIDQSKEFDFWSVVDGREFPSFDERVCDASVLLTNWTSCFDALGHV